MILWHWALHFQSQEKKGRRNECIFNMCVSHKLKKYLEIANFDFGTRLQEIGTSIFWGLGLKGSFVMIGCLRPRRQKIDMPIFYAWDWVLFAIFWVKFITYSNIFHFSDFFKHLIQNSPFKKTYDEMKNTKIVVNFTGKNSRRPTLATVASSNASGTSSGAFFMVVGV